MTLEGGGFVADLHVGVAFDDDAFLAIGLAAQAAITYACNAFARYAGYFACSDDLAASIGVVTEANDSSHRRVLI